MSFRDSTQFFLQVQNDIKAMINQYETREFLNENWDYQNKGGGRTCVLETGNTIEKGGVNFSDVLGDCLPSSATSHRPQIAGQPFRATGVSVVIHPYNPHIPTSHFNVRLFQTKNQEGKDLWWVGGGFDLTPYYGVKEDCILWHQLAKQACDRFDIQLYPRFKKWCDEYFYLKHRKEARGIGGIFFDDFNELSFEQSLEFLRAVTDAYIKAYGSIIAKHKNDTYTEQERAFQLYRRGRYVEFNLIYDRGTLFGLQSGGRTESILMSLPLEASWRYNWQPEPGSKEARLYTEFLPAQEWVKS